MVLPEGFAEERFPGIGEAARADEWAGADLDPDGFLMLEAVEAALAKLRGPDDPSELHRSHGLLLYHAYHHWRCGKPLYLVTTETARKLVSPGEDAGVAEGAGWTPSLPAPSIYAQLPRYLFWAPRRGEEAPEAVDGLFVTSPEGGGLSVLLPAGIRDARPGLTVVALPPVDPREARLWVNLEARGSGEDFRSTLPGGELDELHSFENAGEVLKLVARLLRYMELHPGRVGDREEAAERSAPGEGPAPSRLPYRRIV